MELEIRDPPGACEYFYYRADCDLFMNIQLLSILFFGISAIWFGWRVFQTRSMVRSALSLLASMVSIGFLFLAMEAEFLGVLQIMMMAGEMTIMAVFMVMFMMDPGGMGQMNMTHQKKTAGSIAVAALLAFLVGIFFSSWGQTVSLVPSPEKQTYELGMQILERSMLIFQAAGITILVAMIASIMVAVPERSKDNA